MAQDAFRIARKDMIVSEIWQWKLEDVSREHRLCWFGHVWRMSADVSARKAISWSRAGDRRKRSRLCTERMQKNFSWKDLPVSTASSDRTLFFSATFIGVSLMKVFHETIGQSFLVQW